MRFIEGQNVLIAVLAGSVLIGAGCGGQGVINTANAGPSPFSTNSANSTMANANSSSASNESTTSADVKEPDKYQATVNLKLEATGDQGASALPTISANVARDGQNRRMEFTLPAGGRVVFLDLNGTEYLVMPERNQYAELNKESLGFDVRRLLMPEQIVQQVKALPGVQRVGDEQYNGREVIRYQYGSVADTQTKAGRVDTNSYFLVDKETGLPIRSEIDSKTESGANVKGFNGVKAVTEITNLSLAPASDLFDRPDDKYKKIDPAQVRAQVNLIFNSLTAFVAQLATQSGPAGGNATPTASPAGSPTK